MCNVAHLCSKLCRFSENISKEICTARIRPAAHAVNYALQLFQSKFYFFIWMNGTRIDAQSRKFHFPFLFIYSKYLMPDKFEQIQNWTFSHALSLSLSVSLSPLPSLDLSPSPSRSPSPPFSLSLLFAIHRIGTQCNMNMYALHYYLSKSVQVHVECIMHVERWKQTHFAFSLFSICTHIGATVLKQARRAKLLMCFMWQVCLSHVTK